MKTHADAAPLTQEDLTVTRLGPCAVTSPLRLSTVAGDFVPDYRADDARVLVDVDLVGDEQPSTLTFAAAGAREKIHFDPAELRAAVVTCGGLCPGINNVVRSMVFELWFKYGVRDITGFRYGFEGIVPGVGLPPMALNPDAVRDIHKQGGSMLGLSRGAQSPEAMVDALAARGINALFTVGGDGTQRGAHAVAKAALARGMRLAVVGVPKTVDNDVAFVDKTFGFDTAVELARDAIDCAHTEARGARNGIGIVKLMGRDAGFIAAAASMASHDVNYCLIPEVPFTVEGEHGLLASLEARLALRGHAVIVVAEGCAASMVDAAHAERDASGNVRYGAGAADIGTWMRDRITAHLKSRGVSASVKYIDPSYMVRSVRANASDAIFCDSLARHAVHAAMAGFSDVLVGRWHRHFTLVPLAVATGRSRRVDPDGGLWLQVLETTGQPLLLPPPDGVNG
jgi:6-phosphofructokinase 1